MAASSAGTGSIEIPVLCLLVNGDPSILEVGAGEGGGWAEGPGCPEPPAGSGSPQAGRGEGACSHHLE